jgi:hypothetical protein
MINNILSEFYERDIRKLIDEINMFRVEENVWKVQGSVKNSCGNLLLHIIGGLNFLIGTRLGNTGYVRDREQEFTARGVSRAELVSQLEALIPMIGRTLNGLTKAEMEAEYPAFFDKPGATNSYVLIQLLAHLNYHLGQVNYLRRILETGV